MGQKAAKMLIERIELEDYDDDEEHVQHYKTEIIETQLILRESTN